MPHTTVEYSAAVADTFERRGFAEDLHKTLTTTLGVRLTSCKTRFLRLDEEYLADGSPRYALIHAEVALLSGRAPEVKRELAEAVLALLRRHAAPAPAVEVQFSVALRDLDRETYVKHDEPRVTA
ncbi:5-carboxymethyl-2-hydroxymuconate Delta-isomerase [Actinacidiphila sp. ITFR-21]|uniref:5-carboxymethyl-2-hydroxymuconate Delta-isomerase n=1 Tax=Actinacidiphila sp. ITFR-21 TaxID=3075199 RepID=UPI0028891F18|nr:isomerase [Streptomyces sp. ITFR-21]WNI15247.1 isomerase [Streptomyces sp. ITFR-21]